MSEILDGHRHEDDDQVGVLGVLFGHEDSGTRGIGELHKDVLGREGVEYLDEISGGKSDDDVTPGVVARNLLDGESGVARVVHLYFKQAVGEAELHKPVGGVGAYADTAHSGENRLAVECGHIGVVGRDDPLIRGEVALYEAARQGKFLGGERGGLVGQHHLHILLLCQKLLEQHCGLEGQYKTALYVGGC